MSKFIKVTAKQISNTKDSATYECTISRDNSGYFGLLNKNHHLVVWKAGSNGKGKAYMHWGFPERSKWKSGWGSPDYDLYGGTKVDVGYGSLQGFLQSSYTWKETVSISRGNKRQGSVTVKVGVKAGSNVESNCSSDILKTITLTTTKIAEASNVKLVVEVDPETSSDRKIRVTGSFTNPENHYRMELYKNGGKVSSFTGTYTDTITEKMYNTCILYELRIYGKDNTYYSGLTKRVQVDIGSPPIGLYVNPENSIAGVNSMLFNNVTQKEIKEVWIKVDGKVYKTQR